MSVASFAFILPVIYNKTPTGYGLAYFYIYVCVRKIDNIMYASSSSVYFYVIEILMKHAAAGSWYGSVQ